MIHLNTDRTVRADKGVLALGSNVNYRDLQHPLVANLQEQQLIRSSVLRMGIDTTHGAVIDADGCQSDWLFKLGTAQKANSGRQLSFLNYESKRDRLQKYYSNPS